MDLMKKHTFLLCILLILVCKISFGQEQNEEKLLEQNEQSINRFDWIPSLLNANSNPLYNAVIYNGSNIAWTLRGERHPASVIDGISWESPLQSWRPGDLYAGLQNEFHSTGVSVNGAFSEQSYSTHSTVIYKSAEIQDVKKILSINTSFSNTANTNMLKVHYVNGLNAYKWRQSIGVILQQSPPGFVVNGFKENVGLVFGMDKDFHNNRKFGFSIVWNNASQTKASTTVSETYALSGSKSYQPSWGWYHQQLYFPNTKQTNAPVLHLRFQKNWGESTYLKLNTALVIGTQSQSSLEWTKTADPRPDYYRYLPSYILDTFMRKELTDWYMQHPEQLQMQFDKMEKINQSSFDKQSFYIVNKQNSNLLLLHGSILFSHAITPTFYLSAGSNYAFDEIHYYNTIKDLLGGSYYYNFNGWINDDGSVSSFQNDVVHPDRKIKQGERWGADYLMRAFQFKPWVQFYKEGAVIETTFGMGFGLQGIQRVGYNRNGLFPSNSNGISDLILSPSYDFKGQLVYKISGRLYVRSILFSEWAAPSDDLIYINPALHAITSPYKNTEVSNGVDCSIFYRAPLLKIAASVFWKSKANQCFQKMFYHDAYAAFVYGLLGQMNTTASGIETSIETSLLSNMQLSFVSTLSKNCITNNPQYQLLYVNDIHPLETGVLNLKALPATNSPSLVNALSIQYQPLYSVRIGATFLYAQERPIAIDYFRRSDMVKNKIDAFSWSKLLQPSFLPDVCIVNAFLSKSFQQKMARKLFRWSASVSVRNILNSFVPVIAYEQTRFDYVHFSTNKYAQKFLMDQGVNYSFRIQLQIQ